MNDKIVQLPSTVIKPVAEPQADVIGELRQLMNEALAGDLQGIAFAAVYANGESRTNWAGSTAALQVMGAIALLHVEFAQALNDSE